MRFAASNVKSRRFALVRMRPNAQVRMESWELVSKFLVHDVEQRLALPEPLELRDEKPHGIVQPVGRVVGTVRRKQNIFELIEGMALRQGLLIKNIQRRAFDPAIRERTDERF